MRATPKEVKELHTADDADSARQAHHHTLGWGINQAAGGADTKGLIDSLIAQVATLQSNLTVGEVFLWTGTPAQLPANLLICNGSAFSGVDYPELQAHLGGLILPDWRDRVPVGASGTKAVNSTGGTDTHTLEGGNLPPHYHTIDHNHAAVSVPMQYSADVPTTGAGIRIIRINGQGAGGGGGTSAPFDVDLPAFAGNSGNGPGASTAVNHQNKYYATHYVIRAKLWL